ncbi:hypothetical protein SSX86_018801 [Deinandra increscens subsp. villosa]|uniref:Aspartokinase n=1 Tax=Deinandra increscens subsp. villosa TaxID=3103831 RepID=A0AAP0GV26_9ASTR
MATATHLCGIKTPIYFSKSNRLSQSLCSPERLSFDSLTELCGAIRIPAQSRGRGLKVVCDARKNEVLVQTESKIQVLEGATNKLSCVMKFGGSSVASADRMKEVAELILSFPEENPVIVLSAMGKTTNKLILAGEKAASCVSDASEIDELDFVKELHHRAVDELGLDRSIITDHLENLERLLNGISALKELTPRSRDYLVSFGECMSTRIFAAYLNEIGVKARQYDAFDIGFITTDDFNNADILEETYSAVANRLYGDWISDPAIPIVTGFLGKGLRTCAVTTLGRGGSDLTATTIGKGLGLREIQVWKDVDGVLTCDPNIYTGAEPVPYLTFDEAAELAYFGAQV